MIATKYPLTSEGLAAALVALGETPDAVAGALRAGGWRGVPEAPDSCPVARYLSDVFPDRRIGVDLEEVTVYSGDLRPPYALARLPAPIAEFIAEFDRMSGGSNSRFVDLDETADADVDDDGQAAP